jgi:hypothetical protein
MCIVHDFQGFGFRLGYNYRRHKSAAEGKQLLCLSSSQTLAHRLLRPLCCGMGEQVIYDDGQWDVFKLPNSSVQIFNGLPCGTRSKNSLLHVVLPNGTLPCGTPWRKRARSAYDGAEGSLSEEPTSEADPNGQHAAVRVCRQSASEQTGAPIGSVEGTPAGPVVHCSSHRSVQEKMSPAELTAASGKEPGPPALAQQSNSAPGNKTHQEGRPHTLAPWPRRINSSCCPAWRLFDIDHPS